MNKIKNGRIFIIDKERYFYLHYAFRKHLLVAMDRTQIAEFPRNDGSVYKIVQLVHKYLSDEEMGEVLKDE